MVLFLKTIFSAIANIIASVNQITLTDGVISAGFFDLMIGFVLVNLIIHNLIMGR